MIIALMDLKVKVRVRPMIIISVRNAVGGTSIHNRRQFSSELLLIDFVYSCTLSAKSQSGEEPSYISISSICCGYESPENIKGLSK